VDYHGSLSLQDILIGARAVLAESEEEEPCVNPDALKKWTTKCGEYTTKAQQETQENGKNSIDDIRFLVRGDEWEAVRFEPQDRIRPEDIGALDRSRESEGPTILELPYDLFGVPAPRPTA
jgi:hypothetical protein